MDECRLEEMIAAVMEWQNTPGVSPLRCGNNAAHRPLEPSADAGRVILRCPDCDYCQSYVPSSVLHAFKTGALRRTWIRVSLHRGQSLSPCSHGLYRPAAAPGQGQVTNGCPVG
jgi:hypothetical protein